jgi:hypothetical protein
VAQIGGQERVAWRAIDTLGRSHHLKVDFVNIYAVAGKSGSGKIVELLLISHLLRNPIRNPMGSEVFDGPMRAKAALSLAALVLATMVVTASTIASGADASRSIVLGKTTNYPESGCPDTRRCEVIARVTGVQMRADGVEHPFRVPNDGQLVAWWLKLPRMRRSQVNSFSELFGGGPAARITVLRRGKRGRFRLIRQSSTEVLRRHLGARGRARFRLAEPLLVKEGDYVALSAVTWVPAFAVGLDPVNDTWLASRPKDRCDTPASSDPDRFARYYRQTDAHLEPSTVKHYRCLYQTARLLYWARLEPEEGEPGSPGSS